jgi:hypothetical protein
MLLHSPPPYHAQEALLLLGAGVLLLSLEVLHCPLLRLFDHH